MFDFLKTYKERRKNRFRSEMRDELARQITTPGTIGFSLFENLVQQRLQTYIRGFLNARRVAYCERCLSTDRLRKTETGYLCEADFRNTATGFAGDDFKPRFD